MNFPLHNTRLIVEKIFFFTGFICSFAFFELIQLLNQFIVIIKKVDEERKMEAYAFICRPKYRITVKAKVLFLNLCYITCVFSWIIC